MLVDTRNTWQIFCWYTFFIFRCNKNRNAIASSVYFIEFSTFNIID